MNEIVNTNLIRLIRNHPELLNEEQRQAINSMALLLDGANKVIKEADDADLYEQLSTWRQLWLQSLKSDLTRITYERALKYFDTWVNNTKPNVLHLRYHEAEAFALSNEVRIKQNGKPRSPKSIRAIIEAVSAYYTILERYSEGQIHNPFKGLKSKPDDKALANKLVPEKKEVEALLASTTGIVKAAIAAMAYRGFRIGALPNLELATRNGTTTFKTTTKGKKQTGLIPNKVMNAIKEAGLSKKAPFKDMNVAQIRRTLKKLGYTPHSFRHYFAVTFYEQEKDIEHLRRLLNHVSLDTTKVYLQSLNIIQ